MKPTAILILLLGLILAHCGKAPESTWGEPGRSGYASWYGKKFHGRRTASGEVYDMYALTAAHRTLPFGTHIRVTNLSNGTSVVVRVNDRGPFVRGRIVDLSYAAAKQIGLVGSGIASVSIQTVEHKPPPVAAGDYYLQIAAFKEKENAQRMLDEIATRFPDKPCKLVESNSVSRVYLGPWNSRSDAQIAQETLHKAGYEGARLLFLPYRL